MIESGEFSLIATIDGLEIKVERIDFYQRSFGIFVKDSETTEKLVTHQKISQIKTSDGNIIFNKC